MKLVIYKFPDGSQNVLREAIAFYFQGIKSHSADDTAPLSEHENEIASCCSNLEVVLPPAAGQSGASSAVRSIVQVWHPLKSAMALFERDVAFSRQLADSRSSWEAFVTAHFAMFKRLTREWIVAAERSPDVIIDRDAVAQSPFASLHGIILAVDPDATPDRARLLEASTHLPALRHGNHFHFRHFNLGFFTELEESVEDELRRLRLPRLVSSLFDGRPVGEGSEARLNVLSPQGRKACRDHDGLTDRFAVPRARGLVRVASASLPRSGHHMLQQFLRTYFGDQHSYCQFYEGPLRQPDCCGTYPCTNPDVNFQKCHDFRLSARQIQGQAYIVQFRHPLKACVSAYEQALAYGQNFEDSAEQWKTFAWREIKFFKAFVRRWVLNATLSNTVLLDFDHVVREPLRSLSTVVSLFAPETPPDPERILACVRQVEIAESRDVQMFRHFDLAFFTQLEQHCLDELQRLGVPALFPLAVWEEPPSIAPRLGRKTRLLARGLLRAFRLRSAAFQNQRGLLGWSARLTRASRARRSWFR